MEQNHITFDSLYKNSDCLYQNVILMSKILNQFWLYDSVTDEAVFTNMEDSSDFLASTDICNMNDYLEKILLFSRYAIKSIIKDIHTKIQREYKVLPVQQVRETDSRTMAWLATKPGRNIREKLSGKNKILAPVRILSCDTQENRVFKAYLSSLNNHLIHWKKIPFHNTELEPLHHEIYRWLKSDDASFIHPLNSSAPNNTLLNDKNYRKIWKAWNNIQLLDTIAKKNTDTNILEKNFGLALAYLAVSKLKKEHVQFYQQPFLPNKTLTYNAFPTQHTLATKNHENSILYFSGLYRLENKEQENLVIEIDLNKQGLLIHLRNKRIMYERGDFNKLIREKRIDAINHDLCKTISETLTRVSDSKPYNLSDSVNDCDIIAVNCTQEKPCYSFKRNETIVNGKLNSQLIAQKWVWENESDKKIKIIPAPYQKFQSNGKNLFDISVNDVISLDLNYSSEDLQSAARIFAKQLRKLFPKVNYFVYIMPDRLDDFGNNYLSVAFNSTFPNVIPIPRSISAVFDWQKSKDFLTQNISKNSYVRVIEKIEKDNLSVTDIKLILPDEKLKQKLEKASIPLCITWERQPTEVVKNQKNCTNRKLIKTIIIDNNSKLSAGAFYYFVQQQKVLDISLWKDHLLELAMTADNTEKPIVLVGPNTVVKAQRGKTERIQLPTKYLSIAKGRTDAEFRLIIGKGKENQKKYYAYVKDSNLMPFEQDTICEMELFYSYGQQRPYSLFLKPQIEGQTKKIEVQWESESHKDYIHVPGPNYVEEKTWSEAFEQNRGKLSISASLERSLRVLKSIGEFGWKRLQIKEEYNSEIFFLNETDENRNPYVCFPSKSSKFGIGTQISCTVIPSENMDGTLKYNKKGENTYRAFDLQIKDKKPNRSSLIRYIPPFLELWNQGRTVNSPDFPNKKYEDVRSRIIKYTKTVIDNETLPIAIKNEAIIILSALHEDTDSFLRDLLRNVMQNTINNNSSKDSLHQRKRLIYAVGYAIGNVTLPWQKELLQKAISLGDDSRTVEENNIAIQILGIALWRTKVCVEKLTYKDVKKLFNAAMNNIETFRKEFKNRFANLEKQNLANAKKTLDDFWRYRITCLRAIELILALYRLRNYSKVDEKTLQLLAPSPDNELIQKLKKLFPILEEFCSKEAVYENIWKEYDYKPLFSRIKFEIKDNSRNNSIPDYLYALEKYTEGESGGITVLGISDDSNSSE